MYYVYRFMNKENEVIYVGQTKNLKERLTKQHFTRSGHLPQQCYNETGLIEYTELDSEDDMKFFEDYLIKKIKPKYNRKGSGTTSVSFELPPRDWILYNKDSLGESVKGFEGETTSSGNYFTLQQVEELRKMADERIGRDSLRNTRGQLHHRIINLDLNVSMRKTIVVDTEIGVRFDMFAEKVKLNKSDLISLAISDFIDAYEEE